MLIKITVQRNGTIQLRSDKELEINKGSNLIRKLLCLHMFLLGKVIAKTSDKNYYDNILNFFMLHYSGVIAGEDINNDDLDLQNLSSDISFLYSLEESEEGVRTTESIKISELYKAIVAIFNFLSSYMIEEPDAAKIIDNLSESYYKGINSEVRDNFEEK